LSTDEEVDSPLKKSKLKRVISNVIKIYNVITRKGIKFAYFSPFSIEHRIRQIHIIIKNVSVVGIVGLKQEGGGG